MKDPKNAAQKALERTTAFEDSLEICRALLNAPYSSDYWAGEAECHIRGLWDHTKTLHKLLKAALKQSEWQGLTDDETMHLMNETYGNHWADEAHIQRFRKAIEASLKEKNT